MPSECERFWEAGSYAVIGHQASKKPFPKITYGALKERGVTVYPIDPDGGSVEGDDAYTGFDALPGTVEAAVLELPKEETAAWVGKAADAGVQQIWIHQMTDTPEALAEAEKHGLTVITDHCAVMYNKPGLSMHAPHRWIWKLVGKY
jgi:predicted CoA-binding protein